MFGLIDKFFSKSRKIKLDKEKKASIRESVLAFVKENPCPEIKKPVWLIFALKIRPIFVLASLLFVVVIGGGIVSAKANSAMPGDVLYPIKVGVNEKVLQVLAFSDEAKTDLNVKLAELRLQEAEQLALKDKLTDKIEQQISNNFNENAGEAEKNIKKLNDSEKYQDASTIASGLEASLKAHAKVLEEINGGNIENSAKQKINSIISKINEKSAKVSGAGTVSVEKVADEFEKKPAGLERAASLRMESAKKAIDDARNVLAQVKISDENRKRFEDGLAGASAKILQGQSEIKDSRESYISAISLFQEALTTAKEIQHLLKIKSK